MRKLADISSEELAEVNRILSSEHYYGPPLASGSAVEYQCFTKSRAIYSGLGVVKVFQYLKSVGIAIVEKNK